MEAEGEPGSGVDGSVDVSQGEGVPEDADMKEREKASGEGLVLEEDSNFEQRGGSGVKPVETEGSVSEVVVRFLPFFLLTSSSVFLLDFYM